MVILLNMGVGMHFG